MNNFQDLLKKSINHDDYLPFEAYIRQVLKLLDDFIHVQYALDKSIIIAATDIKGDIIFANDKFCQISKYSRDELIGQNHRILKSGYHDKSFFRDMWKTVARGEIWEGEIKNKAKDGTFYWVKTTIVPVIGPDGKQSMYISFRTDITEGKVAQEKLVAALENDFSMVVNSMYNLVFKVRRDKDRKFIYVLNGGKLASTLGLEGKRMLNKSPQEVFPTDLEEMFEIKYEKAFQGETVNYTYAFNGRHLLTYLSPVYRGGEVIEIIGCVNDISDLHYFQEEVKFMAYHDVLTNLPNRRKFNEDMSEFIQHAKEYNEKFAVFLLNLDHFKQINDSMGHSVGDLLIQEVACRLTFLIEEKGRVYRFTGDKFIIVFPLVDEEKVTLYANEILTSFHKVFTLSNSLEIYTTASIGISIFPEHGEDYEFLLKNADTATFAAKSNGRNTFQLYEPQMNHHLEEVLLMEYHLRRAIQNNEFELYFQPKLDLETGNITSMETLLRWKNPILGNVPPDKFIPIAEEMGLIIQIDEWVLEHACIQNKHWNDQNGSDPLRIAVNISPLHFRLPNFVQFVERILEKTGLTPELLEIEITENSFIDNMEECHKSLHSLRKMGIYVAIDDFGTGFSSLNYLRKFPISSLKIDRAFIQEMEENPERNAIVKAIIYLAHELDLKVVAEGTETGEVIEQLKAIGCDEVQGYFISKPLPKSDFEQLLGQCNKQ